MAVEAVILKKRCGATNRRGEPCGRWAMGNGRCNFHGGKSLKGVAHPNYKHGRRISRLPVRMIDDAIAAMEDRELASMRDDIVVLDARINDLIDRVSHGESGEGWRKLRKAMQEYNKAESIQDADAAKYWWFEIEQMIHDGAADYDAWDEVTKAMQQREKLIAAEQKRLITNGQMIPAERALAILSKIMTAIKENVTDRNALANIARVAYPLMAGPNIEILEADHGETEASRGSSEQAQEVRVEGREAEEGDVPRVFRADSPQRHQASGT